MVDLGKDPVLARRRLEELQAEGFLSGQTRRVSLSMTIYNNALPMFCFLRRDTAHLGSCMLGPKIKTSPQRTQKKVDTYVKVCKALQSL